MRFCNIVAQYLNHLTVTFEDKPVLHVSTAFPTLKKYPELPLKEIAPFILCNGTVQLCDGQWHILPFPLLRCGHIDSSRATGRRFSQCHYCHDHTAHRRSSGASGTPGVHQLFGLQPCVNRRWSVKHDFRENEDVTAWICEGFFLHIRIIHISIFCHCTSSCTCSISVHAASARKNVKSESRQRVHSLGWAWGAQLSTAFQMKSYSWVTPNLSDTVLPFLFWRFDMPSVCVSFQCGRTNGRMHIGLHSYLS